MENKVDNKEDTISNEQNEVDELSSKDDQKMSRSSNKPKYLIQTKKSEQNFFITNLLQRQIDSKKSNKETEKQKIIENQLEKDDDLFDIPFNKKTLKLIFAEMEEDNLTLMNQIQDDENNFEELK